MKTAEAITDKSWILLSAIVATLVVASVPAKGDDGGTYRGTVQAVNLTDNTVTVKGREHSKTFSVGQSTAISTLEKKSKATLQDLRTGFTVEVTYSETNRTAAATSIVEVKAPAEK